MKSLLSTPAETASFNHGYRYGIQRVTDLLVALHREVKACPPNDGAKMPEHEARLNELEHAIGEIGSM